MGVLFQAGKDYAKAVEAYKMSLRNNPADDETRYNLALAQKMLKDQQQNQDQNQDQNKDQQQKQDQQQDKNKDKQNGADALHQATQEGDDPGGQLAFLIGGQIGRHDEFSVSGPDGVKDTIKESPR